MKRTILLVITVLFGSLAFAQNIESYNIEQLKARIRNSDTIYVVNFWATWCGPCVKEIHVFPELEQQYAGKPVKVILVSMDFKEGYPQKIQNFIRKKKLTPEVVWLNETNANEFIPRIAEEWQGSIPATLITYGKNSYRNFFEGMVTTGQLSLLIDKQLAY